MTNDGEKSIKAINENFAVNLTHDFFFFLFRLPSQHLAVNVSEFH